MRRRFPLALVLALTVVVSSVAVATPASTGAIEGDLPPSTATARLASTSPVTGASDPSAIGATGFEAQVVPGENTTRMLRLDGDVTSGGARATVDISPTVGSSREVVASELRRYTVEHRLRNAETTDERRAVLRQETGKVSEQVARLRGMERTALRRYARGEIDETALLRTLARVDTEARALESTLDELQRAVSSTPYMSATEGEIESLTIQLAMHEGPVRAEAARAFRGEVDAHRFHVAVSGDAVVVSTIRGDTYIREATKPGNLDDNTSERYASESEIFDRLETLYPWTWGFVSKEFRTFKTGVYRIQVDHEHGQLTSYVDGSTGEVFREIQTKSLARLPVGDNVTAEANGTVLRVSPMSPSAPVKVTLTSTRGEPVDAMVYLNGERVGTTQNGALWLLSPHERYTVTAVRDRGNVSVTTSPTN